MKFLPDDTKLKFGTKLHAKYNKITYNHKMVHVKLGSESYELVV